jgi:hypothetical protein
MYGANGRYIPTSNLGIPSTPANGVTLGDQISKFIKDCNGTAVWQSQPKAFADVPAEDAFAGPIASLSIHGVLGGYPCGGPGEPCDGTSSPYFRPSANVTRGQAAKIVSNAAGFSEDPGAQTFADVEPGDPFYPFIQRLSGRGVLGGYPCGGPGEGCDEGNRPYFRPGANVTRGQLSKIVSNTAGLSDTSSDQPYGDVPPSSPFYQFIMRLYLHNATNDLPCGAADMPCTDEQKPYFGPNVPATRAETSLFVANIFYPEGPPMP